MPSCRTYEKLFEILDYLAAQYTLPSHPEEPWIQPFKYQVGDTVWICIKKADDVPIEDETEEVEVEEGENTEGENTEGENTEGENTEVEMTDDEIEDRPRSNGKWTKGIITSPEIEIEVQSWATDEIARQFGHPSAKSLETFHDCEWQDGPDLSCRIRGRKSVTGELLQDVPYTRLLLIRAGVLSLDEDAMIADQLKRMSAGEIFRWSALPSQSA